MSLSASDWLSLILLGLLVGAVGQTVRTLMGLYKWSQRRTQENQQQMPFSPARLSLSIVIGGCAGGLAAMTLDAAIDGVNPMLVSAETILALFAAGYAGTDFIEGTVRARLPSTG